MQVFLYLIVLKLFYREKSKRTKRPNQGNRISNLWSEGDVSWMKKRECDLRSLACWEIPWEWEGSMVSMDSAPLRSNTVINKPAFWNLIRKSVVTTWKIYRLQFLHVRKKKEKREFYKAIFLLCEWMRFEKRNVKKQRQRLTLCFVSAKIEYSKPHGQNVQAIRKTDKKISQPRCNVVEILWQGRRDYPERLKLHKNRRKSLKNA